MPHKRAKRSVREQQRKERGADLAPSGHNNPTGISTERVPKSAARVLDAERIRAEYRRKRAQLRTEKTDGIDDTGASKLPPRKKRRTTITTTAPAMDTGVLVEEEKGKSKSESKVSLAKKGKGEDRPIGGPIEKIEIQPGESLKHFNRRVEDHMRPLVRSAMLASAATERKERKKAVATTSATTTTHGNKPKAHAEDPPSTKTAYSRNGDDDDNRPKEFATMSSAAPRRLNDIAMAPPELKKLPRGAAKRSPGGKATAAGVGVLSMAQRAMMEVERKNAIRRYREMKERKAKESDPILLLLHGERHADGG